MTDILDQIDHALGDHTVGPDAMRWTPDPPAVRRWGEVDFSIELVAPATPTRWLPRDPALRQVLGCLTPAVLERMYLERHAFLVRGLNDRHLMILWPEHWVAFDRHEFSAGAQLMGLRLTLACIADPVVVALSAPQSDDTGAT